MRFLSVIFVLGITAGLFTVCAESQEAADDASLSMTRIELNDELFCEVITGNGSQHGDIPRPFIYPIIGPTGAAMTRGYPMDDSIEGEAHDHPHHRSLWFAHGDVNGIDFWAQGEGKGRIVCTDVFGGAGDSPMGTADAPVVIAWSQWVSPDETVLMTDQQLWKFSADEDGTRFIDYAINMTPGEDIERVIFGDTKEGTMAIRTHPALRLRGDIATGHAINSEGDTDRALWGKRAAWVAYWGEVDGESCGIAIFDDPTNLRHPTYWHARDYGLVAANPFGIHDFADEPEGTGDYTLAHGETFSLRYRLVFFAGTAADADIAGKYDQWVASMIPEDQDDQE